MIVFILASSAVTNGNRVESASFPARLANGIVIEGVITEISAEGIMIQSAKGKNTYPWKYLSSGTRFRYQRALTFEDAGESTPPDTQEAP